MGGQLDETGMMEWNEENQPPILLLHRIGHGWCNMPYPAFCNHTRSVCPILVTRLETDLAGVWLLRLLPGTYLRLQLYLTFKQSRLNENK